MRNLVSGRARWAVAAGLLMLPLLHDGSLTGVGPALAGDSSGKGATDTAKTEPSKTEPAKTETPKAECRPVVDAAKVYLGQAATCKAPSVVDADRVYRSIPEYKRIVEKGLTEKDAEYSLLLLKATRRFRAAVEAAAKDGSYDLVAAVGAVKWEGHTVPDVTDAAVRKIAETVK